MKDIFSKIRRADIPVSVAFIGIILIAFGTACIYMPAGLIIAGVLMILAALDMRF